MKYNRTWTTAFCIALTLPGTGCVLHYSRVRTPEVGEPVKGVRAQVPLHLVSKEGTYLTRAFMRRLLESPTFVLVRKSNVRMHLVTNTALKGSGEKNTVVPFCLTLGLFPMVGSRPKVIEFVLRSDSAGEEIRRYRYAVDHYLTGHLFALLLVPVNLFSFDSIEIADPVGTITDVGTAQKVALARFERDLARDLERPELRAHFTSGNAVARKYVLLPVTGKSMPVERNRFLYESLETSLSVAGLALVERRRLAGILDEQVLARTGLTDGARIQIGRLTSAGYALLPEVVEFEEVQANPDPLKRVGKITIALRCVGVEDGVIAWKRKVSLNARYSPETTRMIDMAVRMLVWRLQHDGTL